MIRKTVNNTRQATFCIQLPEIGKHGMPYPKGTGFFVSPDGIFITAAHVITKNGKSNGEVRDDFESCFLMKETYYGNMGAMCQFVEILHVIPEYDIAFLKVDFEKNSNKEWLKNSNSFPFIEVSTRMMELGEPAYSFGYPLSDFKVEKKENVTMGFSRLSPRLTSAVVSSDFEVERTMSTPNDPKVYVLDKALNYGNSGGPIVSTDTGKVHAICSRFQPVGIPQNHLTPPNGKTPVIMIPSLYGVVSSLNNNPIIDFLKSHGVTISED